MEFRLNGIHEEHAAERSVKAEFHNASWFEACLRPASNQLA